MNFSRLVILLSLLVASCSNSSVSSKELSAIDPQLNTLAKQLKTTVSTTVRGHLKESVTKLAAVKETDHGYN